jgi:uncharacterized protein (DUF2141 family)
MNLLKLSALTLSLVAISVSAQTVQLDIQEIKHNQGKLYVQIFKGEQNYKQGKAYNSTIVKAEEGNITITFNDLEVGDYAIRYFHDENDNGDMDTNFFGFPAEGYGFSNTGKVKYGPPSYKEMSFQVAEQPVKAHSTVNY